MSASPGRGTSSSKQQDRPQPASQQQSTVLYCNCTKRTCRVSIPNIDTKRKMLLTVQSAHRLQLGHPFYCFNFHIQQSQRNHLHPLPRWLVNKWIRSKGWLLPTKQLGQTAFPVLASISLYTQKGCNINKRKNKRNNLHHSPFWLKWHAMQFTAAFTTTCINKTHPSSSANPRQTILNPQNGSS